MEPIHFLDEPITVRFESPPAREKLPPCPDGFTAIKDLNHRKGEWVVYREMAG